MNYHNPELADELAKRYVLGTMSARVRQRFACLMMTHSNLQHAVWHWEQLLNPMANQLAPVAPSAHVWPTIVQQLGWQEQSKTTKAFSFRGLFSNIVAVAASLMLAIVLWLNSSQPQPVHALAMLNTEQAQTAWIAKRQTDQIVVIAETVPTTNNLNVFELWMLPKSGLPPVSLGILPKSGEKILRDRLQIEELIHSGLAVSIEPIGGSPTGQPTGQVILTAQWILI